MKRVIMPVQQAQCGRLVLVNDKHGLNGVSGRFLELERVCCLKVRLRLG